MNHKPLPFNPDAEKAVLSSFFLSPQEIGCMIAERGIQTEHFHHSAHSILFETMMKRWHSGKPIEPIAVIEDLRNANLIKEVGGPAAVTEILSLLPTAASASNYIEIIEQKRDLREIINMCHDMSNRAYDEQDNVQGLIAELEQKALAIGEKKAGEETPFRDHVIAGVARIQEAFERKGKLLGMSCGIDAIDQMTSGLCDTDYIVISAETSGGKTALALRFLEAVALQANAPAAVFSFEMTNDQLVDRILSGNARTNLQQVRNGNLTQSDITRISASAARIAPAKIFLRDDSEMTIAQIRAISRRLKRRHGIRLVIVDYAQLVPPMPFKGSRNREQEVAEISRNLKAMAKELKLPVIALSQLNDEGKLRESRAIAHDANIIMTIQCQENEDGSQSHFVDIGKNRNGPRGRVQVRFIASCARFEGDAE